MLAIILAGVLLTGGCGQPGTNQLPQEVLVPLEAVQNHFPEIATQNPPSENTNAAGIPDATRMAIYEGDDGKKVTVSVDRYPGPDSASTAFEEAIDKSEAVQGFAALPPPIDVGDRAFAGTVSQGDDTHIGYGALAGEYVIGVTSAGYPATIENTAKLIDLTREAVGKAGTA
ncbi:hypothetical protein O4215_25565 [Rhodococcus maanshanensis]|uniref:hypothetical protein n=1 Tax=Rhodococcus maanshanensis TaxID=183556 RepID=UPI0022B59A5A|nr:hypothetical protein [Rhodococcus maanshanensis]MCZ4558934.1 hypothetical protein [Rhodococcus maanshanensis]